MTLSDSRFTTALVTVSCFTALGCADAPLTPSPEGTGPNLGRTSLPFETTDDWVEEVFIDRRANPNHAGPGPHPTDESDRFALIQGGIHWVEDGDVLYKISGAEGVDGGNDEIEQALSIIDVFVTTRSFARDDDTPSENPCGGVNEVVWAPIDGPGDVLAATRVCRNVATKEIAGFAVTLDTGETWSVSGEADKIDVRNVSVHEFGHVAGLDHVNAPRDGCLTMYTYAGAGETQKRTLGLGDKLGMNRLYGSADIAAGACNS